MAFPDGHERKCALTINYTSVPGDQTNFPVMLIWNGSTGNLPSEVYNNGANSPRSDGSDIRFSSDIAGKTQLPFEIVTFSPNSTVANARVLIYVKLASISSASNTVFYIWYKNGEASALPVTDTYGRNNVWTNEFVGVFHLNEPSGDPCTNSVGSNDGTYYGTSFPNRVDTTYGYMQNFVNANDNRVYLGGGSPWNITGNISISAIITVTAWTSSWQAIVAKGDGTYRLARDGSNNGLQFDRYTGSVRSATNSTDISTGAYFHVAGTFGTTVGSYAYVNGTAGSLQSNTDATESNSDYLDIGRNVDYTARDWNGYIGEVRIANVERSSTWVTTEYNTLVNFTSFVTAGTPVNVFGVQYSNTNTGTSTSSSFSFNHTLDANSNRVVIVSLTIESTGSVITATVTYNGVAMTQIGSVDVVSSSTHLTNYLFEILDANLPSLAGTYSVAVTLSATPSAGTIATAREYWNAKQVIASQTSNNTTTSTNAISASLTPVENNSAIVSVVGCGSAGSYTVTSPHVETFDLTLASTMTGAGGHSLDCSGSTTITWTYVPGGALNRQALLIAALPPYIPILGGIELGVNF